jgi:transposase
VSAKSGETHIEGPVNTEVFLTFLDQVLCPALRPGQVVVMDQLNVHKAAAVRQRLEACGCRLVFLPAYSPDFNPIEEAFSKLKTYLRRQKARTRERLGHALTPTCSASQLKTRAAGFSIVALRSPLNDYALRCSNVPGIKGPPQNNFYFCDLT